MVVGRLHVTLNLQMGAFLYVNLGKCFSVSFWHPILHCRIEDTFLYSR